MLFRNPTNNYAEEVSIPGLWTFLFGTFYFIAKGIWTHALLSALLALCTFGISWLIYPFFASGIVRAHYGKKGWVEIGPHYFATPLIGTYPPRE
jgi:PEGA domain